MANSSIETSSWTEISPAEQEARLVTGRIAQGHLARVSAALMPFLSPGEAEKLFASVGNDGNTTRRIGDTRTSILRPSGIHMEAEHIWEGNGIEALTISAFP